MRISTHEQLLALLDDIVAGHERGDRTSHDAADFWSRMLTQEGHPLATPLPDECVTDWLERGLLRPLVGARVLDVGCGNGRNSRWFAGQGAHVVGIDIAAPLLEQARPHMPDGVVLAVVDVLRDPLPGGQFDVIYDSGCFHHLPPHRRASYLERLLPRLAPGGQFGIVTFAAEEQPAPDDRELVMTGNTAGGMSFTRAELEAIFAGLRPLEVRAVRDCVPDTFGATFLNAGLFANS